MNHISAFTFRLFVDTSYLRKTGYEEISDSHCVSENIFGFQAALRNHINS